MKTVFLGLGSNVGDRAQALQTAINKLHSSDLQVERISSVYESAAVDYLDQPDFLNCVVELKTNLLPLRLLLRIQNIEREMGRKRYIPKGPRSIDIDILLHGHAVVQTSQLQIPHPGITERRFVLEPLVELTPDLRHPMLGRRFVEILGSAPHQRIVRLATGLDLPAR